MSGLEEHCFASHDGDLIGVIDPDLLPRKGKSVLTMRPMFSVLWCHEPDLSVAYLFLASDLDDNPLIR